MSSECGLLKDLLIPVTEKPSQKEHHQEILTKVVETLDNGTTIIIDALGNVIHINPSKNNEESAKTKGTFETTTKSPSNATEVVKKDELSKSTETKPDLNNNGTEKVKVVALNFTKDQNQTTSEIEQLKPKTEEIKENTLPTETNKGISNTTSNINNGDAKNITESGKVDNQSTGVGQNCTETDHRCGDVKKVVSKIDDRMLFDGDKCPNGKDRAADGICVEVE